MKNLKKVLSLVLALAMALSLMTAAFAADAGDYKDYNEVTYKEAVDVMTAAGVFNGSDSICWRNVYQIEHPYVLQSPERPLWRGFPGILLCGQRGAMRYL